MQVNNFFIDLALRLLFIFFTATIQIGVIVQVCYTPHGSSPSVCNLYMYHKQQK